MEREEDAWAGTGMDDDEETLPKKRHAGEDAGEESGYGREPEDQEEEQLPISDEARREA